MNSLTYISGIGRTKVSSSNAGRMKDEVSEMKGNVLFVSPL